jgi:hypothetical protein
MNLNDVIQILIQLHCVVVLRCHILVVALVGGVAHRRNFRGILILLVIQLVGYMIVCRIPEVDCLHLDFSILHHGATRFKVHLLLVIHNYLPLPPTRVDYPFFELFK